VSTSGKYQGAFVPVSLASGKIRLKAASLEVRSKSDWVTCSHEQRVVRCCKFLAEQKHQRLISYSGDLKPYTPFNGEPVEHYSSIAMCYGVWFKVSVSLCIPIDW